MSSSIKFESKPSKSKTNRIPEGDQRGDDDRDTFGAVRNRVGQRGDHGEQRERDDVLQVVEEAVQEEKEVDLRRHRVRLHLRDDRDEVEVDPDWRE